ncbi:class I SAM-dependent methyltransferase [Massilia sp. SM-13]|uniref:class I SAM-dependent methyltransferase n=1 Tax=Pseudoduganella rhizocola TaxID=3382643 RepID=UPI0038B4DD03
MPLPLRRLLHVGCGTKNIRNLPAYFHHGWQELRYDIDAKVNPDLTGSITDLGAVQDGSVTAIWSSHNLEHLNSFEVPRALEEFRRVLSSDGFAVITVPDLRAVARHIANDELEQPLYKAPAGAISALDVVFGHQAAIERGNGYMAHRTGFSARTLGQALVDAGFAEVRVHEGRHWDLWAIATMPETDVRIYQDLASVLQ